MTDNHRAPNTEEAIKERSEMLQLIEQCQQQVFIAQQRVAFLNGVLSARDIDVSTLDLANSTDRQTPKK